ncbi:MAG: hypothetical protein CM15mP125_0910 [Gammaproteobacteria bacterium]|nr:MAG: hypothetical protein CM15mP125_0910 [Gammaproteobacteria bacterium]
MPPAEYYLTAKLMYLGQSVASKATFYRRLARFHAKAISEFGVGGFNGSH